MHFYTDNIILVVRFLGQATIFSVTQNIPKYQFLKGTIDIYHYDDHVFMGKGAQNSA